MYHTAVKPYSMIITLAGTLLLAGCGGSDNDKTDDKVAAQVGPRPLYLITQMQDSELKTTLAQCRDQPFYRSDFSIGHRGAAMQFPEHTRESYQAAIDSGAGIVECDVTFTSDKALVCRHSQCDLAATTNILSIPELAAQCSVPFTPAANGEKAQATCCTSDITLAQFKTLKGKMDGVNPNATNVEQFMAGTANWRTDLYSGNGTLMTHAESIAMFKAAGVKMTPELKSAAVQMPFDGFSQQDYAQKMLDEYQAADVPASQVYPQSFHLEDIQYWISNTPEFANQAVFLDERNEHEGLDPQNPDTWVPNMDELKNQGVEYIAPPLWMLVTLDNNKKIVPSEYAKAAKAAQLNIITWSLERSGIITDVNETDGKKGGWYYQSIEGIIDNEGVAFELLDVLAKDVGVKGVFSDWPATVTYYANCMGIKD
ncbi:glycerophosphodiester phosphodiesterase [Shewanella sp. VB17]|uniref:glycerophosphodiester phosphodiesterase family protein n=1 Tax=Shewanella sp. VB17 TaxID=2739432 RepID=UPI001564C9AF|nr:glycerophosphodiester phosphodiesterase family protein [Shewanella sp. VB17]NRD72612.1 glycerophosphodiester phosphodiesterase [Shewanella sp. VB17]